MKRRRRRPVQNSSAFLGRNEQLFGMVGRGTRWTPPSRGGRTDAQSTLGGWPIEPFSENQLFPFKEGGSHCSPVSVDEQILGGRSHHRNRCYLKQMSLINLKSGGVFTRLHI